MIEPLFRSGSPFLAGIPSPAFGWLPSSPPLNARPATGTMPGIVGPPSLAQPPMAMTYGFPGPMSPDAPAFPLAAEAMQPLRGPAEAKGSTDFTPLWSGQAPTLAREMPAGELVAAMVREAGAVFSRLRG